MQAWIQTIYFKLKVFLKTPCGNTMHCNDMIYDLLSNFQSIPKHNLIYKLKSRFVYSMKTLEHGGHHGQVWQDVFFHKDVHERKQQHSCRLNYKMAGINHHLLKKNNNYNCVQCALQNMKIHKWDQMIWSHTLFFTCLKTAKM